DRGVRMRERRGRREIGVRGALLGVLLRAGRGGARVALVLRVAGGTLVARPAVVPAGGGKLELLPGEVAHVAHRDPAVRQKIEAERVAEAVCPDLCADVAEVVVGRAARMPGHSVAMRPG